MIPSSKFFLIFHSLIYFKVVNKQLPSIKRHSQLIISQQILASFSKTCWNRRLELGLLENNLQNFIETRRAFCERLFLQRAEILARYDCQQRTKHLCVGFDKVIYIYICAIQGKNFFEIILYHFLNTPITFFSIDKLKYWYKILF